MTKKPTKKAKRPEPFENAADWIRSVENFGKTMAGLASRYQPWPGPEKNPAEDEEKFIAYATMAMKAWIILAAMSIAASR